MPASPTSESVTSTPLVLAMPEPMAKALGWPDAPIGWADVLALATDPQGWASKGHPEWGKFTLGKTNPNVSTSGLAATIGTLVAATGTSSDLTQAALQRPEVQQYLKDVESSVIHYGDTTLTYLSNLQRADDAGAALGYLSAVGGRGEERARLQRRQPQRRPEDARRSRRRRRCRWSRSIPRRARSTATARTSSSTRRGRRPRRRPARRTSWSTCCCPSSRRSSPTASSAPPIGSPGEPITSSPYLIADGVTIALNPPGPEVLRDVRALWAEVRKSARVLVLMDVSGSMAGDSGSGGKSKLDLAKSAATTALGSAGRHRPGRVLGVHHRSADPEHDHRGSGRRRAAERRPGSRSPTRSPG